MRSTETENRVQKICPLQFICSKYRAGLTGHVAPQNIEGRSKILLFSMPSMHKGFQRCSTATDLVKQEETSSS